LTQGRHLGNNMTKEKLTSEFKQYVSQTAQHKNPQITANAVYFVTKQFSSDIEETETYRSILHQIKFMLLNSFNWEMSDIHKCFCEIKELTKYF
jgi:hypothetical protein